MLDAILALVGVLLLVGILFKIIKSLIIVKILMRLAAVLFLVLVLMIAYTAFNVYKDYKDFSENFPNSDNLFIIEHKGEPISGFVMQNNNGTQNVEFIDIKEIKTDYRGNADKLLEDYYKIIVVDTEAFKDMRVEVKGKKLNYADVEEFLEDDSISLGTFKIDLSGLKTQEVKDYMLGAFTMKLFQDPRAIITNMRAGYIDIIEETAMFKLVKDVPSFIINPMFEKGFVSILSADSSSKV